MCSPWFHLELALFYSLEVDICYEILCCHHWFSFLNSCFQWLMMKKKKKPTEDIYHNVSSCINPSCNNYRLLRLNIFQASSVLCSDAMYVFQHILSFFQLFITPQFCHITAIKVQLCWILILIYLCFHIFCTVGRFSKLKTI